MSATRSSSSRVRVVPGIRRERVPLTVSTSSRLTTMRCSRSRPRSRMIIAVISLVIEAMGTMASLFLLNHLAGGGILHHHGRRAQVDDLLRLGLGKTDGQRSEERRVEKECRSRWSPYH